MLTESPRVIFYGQGPYPIRSGGPVAGVCAAPENRSGEYMNELPGRFFFYAPVKQDRASPQRRPNTIIISQQPFDVNYLCMKSLGFSVLYHLS